MAAELEMSDTLAPGVQTFHVGMQTAYGEVNPELKLFCWFRL